MRALALLLLLAALPAHAAEPVPLPLLPYRSQVLSLPVPPPTPWDLAQMYVVRHAIPYPTSTSTATPVDTATATATATATTGGAGGPAQIFWVLPTTNGATRYAAWTNTSTETYAQFRMPSSGRASNLYVYCPTAPSGGTIAVTLRDAASSKAVTCTVADGTQTCSDTSNTYDYAADATLAIMGVNTASNAPTCQVALKITANGGSGSHPGILAWAVGGTFTTATGTLYGGPLLAGNSAIGHVHHATEGQAAWPMSTACTLSGFSVKAHTTLGSGAERAYTLRSTSGGVDTDLAVTLNDATSSAADTTCTSNCTVAAGDVLVAKNVESGTSGSRSVQVVVECTDQTDIIGGSQRLNTDTRYFVPNQLGQTTMTDALQRVPTGGTLKNLRVRLNTTPASTHTITVCTGSTPGGVSCSGTRPTCTLTTSDTTCADTDAGHGVAVSAGDYFSLEATSPGSGTYYFGYSVALVP